MVSKNYCLLSSDHVDGDILHVYFDFLDVPSSLLWVICNEAWFHLTTVSVALIYYWPTSAVLWNVTNMRLDTENKSLTVVVKCHVSFESVLECRGAPVGLLGYYLCKILKDSRVQSTRSFLPGFHGSVPHQKLLYYYQTAYSCICGCRGMEEWAISSAFPTADYTKVWKYKQCGTKGWGRWYRTLHIVCGSHKKTKNKKMSWSFEQYNSCTRWLRQRIKPKLTQISK